MTRLEQLRAEESAILARRKRREIAEDRDRKRLRELEALIHREQLIALVGIEGAVKVGYRQRYDHSLAFLNDARGTIKKVNRTIAIVKWDKVCPRDGYAGDYRWHLSNLKPVGDFQGCTFDPLCSGDGLETR